MLSILMVAGRMVAGVIWCATIGAQLVEGWSALTVCALRANTIPYPVARDVFSYTLINLVIPIVALCYARRQADRERMLADSIDNG